MTIVKWVLMVYSLTCCASPLRDSFESRKLTSSKGENIYVNSVNWGVTDDHQLSIISSDSNRLGERTDTLGTVKGLDPFIYSFNNDSLKLYFHGKIRYRIAEKFKTIIVTYHALDPKVYYLLAAKSESNNSYYYSVPIQKRTSYPADMPKPK